MSKQEYQQIVKKGVLIGVGLAAYAQEKTEKLVKELVKKGKINKTEGKKLVKNIYQEVDKSRKRVSIVVEKELKRLFKDAKPVPKKKTTKKTTKKTKK